MSARLVPITPGPAPAMMLQRAVMLVGRHPECDVRIDSMKVSRRHCCLAMANNRILIRDLGSRNGVRVNGRPVEESQLIHGDEVAIGPWIYRVEDMAIIEPPARPTPQPVKVPPPAAPPAPPADDDGVIDLIPLDEA